LHTSPAANTERILRCRKLEPPAERGSARRLTAASGGLPWIGGTLAIGDAVRLSLTGPCPRCVMTTLPQGDLAKDPGILRTAAQHNHANVGLYASVVRGGTVRRGDAIRVE
jgi:hypothetical protein